jgi:hypothetical protein
LQVKLPTEKRRFLPFGPLDLSEFLGTRAAVDGQEKFVIVCRDRTQFDLATAGELKRLTPTLHI